MRVLRRILAKASQKKVRNLFQVVFYFILLFGNLACLFIYINVQKEAEKECCEMNAIVRRAILEYMEKRKDN